MKTILTINLFLFTLLISPNFYCQEIEYSEIYSPEKKMPIYNKHVGLDDKYNVYVEYKGPNNSYHVRNIKTGETVVSDFIKIKEDNKTAYVSQFVIQGDYVYELCNFVANSYAVKGDFGLIKRSLITFEQEGEILWFAKDYDISGNIYNNFDLTYNDNGFIVSTGIKTTEKTNCFVSCYDWDLQMKWTKDLNFLKQEGLSIDEQILQPDGQAILSIKFQNPEKGFTFKDQKIKSSVLTFLVIDSAEELLIISPEYDSKIVFTDYDVFYDSKKSELVSIFNITELTNPNKEKVNGSGIAYFKHNKDGNLIISSSKMFTYKDILDDEILASLSKNNIKLPQSLTENYPNMGNHPTVRMKNNGHFIFRYDLNENEELQNKINEHLTKSGFYLEINENGEILWQRTFFCTNSEVGVKNSDVYGNDFFIITAEAQESYEKKSYLDFKINEDMTNIKKVWVFYTIDENGEISAPSKLDLNPHNFPNPQWFIDASNEPRKYMIKFQDAKKTKMYYSIITLN